MDPSKQDDVKFEDDSTICKVKIEQFSDDSHEDSPCLVNYLPDTELVVKKEERSVIEKENGNEERMKNSPRQLCDEDDVEHRKVKKRSSEVLDESDKEDKRASKKPPIEKIFIKVENLFEEDIKCEPSEASNEIREHPDSTSKSSKELTDIVKEASDEFKDDLNKEGREANGKQLANSINSKMKDLLEKKMNYELSDASDETVEDDGVSNSSKESSDSNEELEHQSDTSDGTVEEDDVPNSSEESSDANEELEKKRPKISSFPDYEGRSRTSNNYVKLYSESTLTNMAFVANERAAKAKRFDQKPKVAESIKLNILEEAKANFIGGMAAKSVKKETQTEKESEERVPPVPPILSNASLKDSRVKSSDWYKLESVKALLKTL